MVRGEVRGSYECGAILGRSGPGSHAGKTRLRGEPASAQVSTSTPDARTHPRTRRERDYHDDGDRKRPPYRRDRHDRRLVRAWLEPGRSFRRVAWIPETKPAGRPVPRRSGPDPGRFAFIDGPGVGAMVGRGETVTSAREIPTTMMTRRKKTTRTKTSSRRL